MFRKSRLIVFIGALGLMLAPALSFGQVPNGAEQVLPLAHASQAGAGAFIARGSNASAAALNPAAGALEQRLTVDASYILISDMASGEEFGHSVDLGVLMPTRFAVFSSSLQFLTSPFEEMPLGSNFTASLQISKELWSKLGLGLGLKLGAGTDSKIVGDIGMRYNIGKLGPFNDFAWAVVLSDLGVSPAPAAFTPRVGVDFTLFKLKDNKKGLSPLAMQTSAELAIPGFVNASGALGLHLSFFERVNLHASMDFNLREMLDKTNRSFIPALAIDARIPLSGKLKEKIKALPTEGEIIISTPVRPLYNDIWAIGGGIVLHSGLVDRTPPLIALSWPEEAWISPNADGKKDALEFPISITDRRYVMAWVFDIYNEQGELVHSIQNKERRPENEGFKDFFARLTDVKSGVDIPEQLRWDGFYDNGELASDGTYYFTISATDDNGNSRTSESYYFHIDTAPPRIAIEGPKEDLHIFSPDGDGNKDSFAINLSGSHEELWTLSVEDAAGTPVRSFDIIDGSPSPIIWDGKNDSGQIVADGVYRFMAQSIDRAANECRASLENIIVNTEQPVVNILINDPYFSPNGDGVKDFLVLYPQVPQTSGAQTWKLEVLDGKNIVQKTLGATGSIPREISLDGRDDRGKALPEGSYRAKFTVVYQNGSEPHALSPAFALDITAPTANLSAKHTAFSPNGDGVLDTMDIDQKASEEWLWTGEIRRLGSSSSAAPTKTYSFEGEVPRLLQWNGRNDQGALAPDGEYEYSMRATDRAGNVGESNSIVFELSTADTPLMVTANREAFSPNGDGSMDTITISPQFKVIDGIESWRMAIVNAREQEVRVFEGRNTAPKPQLWDGRDASGKLVSDGAYSVLMNMNYRAGNRPEARSEAFVVDTVAPELELGAKWTIFSPNGDGRKDSLPFTLRTPGKDSWTAEILNAANTSLRQWKWTGQAPNIEWDGNDRVGNLAPDGRYRFVVQSTDPAGNKTSASIENISLDTSSTKVFLTSSAPAFAPLPKGRPNSLTLTPIINNRNGIESWKLEILDSTGKLAIDLREKAGEGIPQKLIWDGKDAKGAIKDGQYRARLEVNYLKGDVSVAEVTAIVLDTTAPELSFASSPEYFSPDNDGIEDELFIMLGIQDASPIEAWSLEVYEPGDKLFWQIQGTGSPSEKIVWDGKSNKGELVQSATDYQVVFKAQDAVGNASELRKTIGIDVLVLRVGNQLRIQVPSIIFRENANDFKGLPTETISNNERVLKRIATILNKFRDYKIVVEGHANPVSLTANEEKELLKPLSEARAQAVMEKLIEFGVDKNRLSYIGMGGTSPVIAHKDRDNWWKNRRVEFILIK